MNEQKNEEIQKELNEISRDACQYIPRVLMGLGFGIFGFVSCFVHYRKMEQLGDILIVVSALALMKAMECFPIFSSLKKRTKELKSKLEH